MPKRDIYFIRDPLKNQGYQVKMNNFAGDVMRCDAIYNQIFKYFGNDV